MIHDLFHPSGGKDAPPTGERRRMGGRRDDAMAIVSGPDCQEALRFLLDRQERFVQALIVPEPENPQDPTAVAVLIEGRKVGYLTADVARRYGPLVAVRATPMRCPAELHGGDWDMPGISVILDFSAVYAASREP